MLDEISWSHLTLESKQVQLKADYFEPLSSPALSISEDGDPNKLSVLPVLMFDYSLDTKDIPEA